MRDEASEIFQALREGARCVLLRGAAGTGKTTLVRELLPAIRAMGYESVLMAPTGRAAKILASRTGHVATTIHSAIYKIPDEPTWDEKLELWRWVFTLKEKTPAQSVIIVDESSMVGTKKHVEEHLVFGTGSLLEDLVRWSGLCLPECTNRIIFVGDSWQLPPVGEPPGTPPALDPEVLEKMLGKRPMVVNLEKVWRQDEQSGILKEASRIRSRLSYGLFDSFGFLPHDDIGLAEAPQIREFYQENADLDQTMILAHTNKHVWDYNQMVRGALGRGESALVPGERLLSLRNTTIGNLEDGLVFRNGDLLEATSILGEPFEIVGFYRERGSSAAQRMTFTFRKMFVRWTGEPKRGEVDCWVNVTPIVSEVWRKDPEAAGQALYVAVRRNIEEKYKNEFATLQPTAKTVRFRELLRQSPLLHAPIVTYGYALTVHKAQGGDWKRVWVDCDYAGGMMNESYFRWLYTAVTRAKKRLDLVQAPQIDVLCEAVTKRLSELRETVAPAPATTAPTGGVVDGASVAPMPSSLAEILRGDGLVISKVDPLSWVHRCYVENEQTHAPCGWIDVGYNGKGVVTNIAVRAPTLPNDLGARILALKGSRVSRVMQTETANAEQEPPEINVQPVHQAVAKRLLDAAERASLQVLNLKSLNTYQLRFEIRSELGDGYVDWYFNGKGSVTEMGNSTVSAQVLTTLRDALKGGAGGE